MNYFIPVSDSSFQSHCPVLKFLYGLFFWKFWNDFSNCFLTNTSFFFPQPRLYSEGDSISTSSSLASPPRKLLMYSVASFWLSSLQDFSHLAMISYGTVLFFNAFSYFPMNLVMATRWISMPNSDNEKSNWGFSSLMALTRGPFLIIPFLSVTSSQAAV